MFLRTSTCFFFDLLLLLYFFNIFCITISSCCCYCCSWSSCSLLHLLWFIFICNECWHLEILKNFLKNKLIILIIIRIFHGIHVRSNLCECHYEGFMCMIWSIEWEVSRWSLWKCPEVISIFVPVIQGIHM